MAQDVKFNIKLSIDGKEHLVTASTNVKRLAQEMEIAQTETTKFRDALLSINQVGEAFQNAFSGLQQLTGLVQEYTAASAEQEVNEAKLANNMRNTMGARDEDIQSIKDLCAAQQRLGVIGDEVQLAGAQELSTYLEKKSSLEKLIPVMNDMLAQQNGLNATQENAANIATMLGKVMDGQTSALSRYGYKFDEAQEQILKFGTEEERAAVLAEVVESAVGGMNAELAKTDAGKAKQAANDFGDLKESIGALFAPIEGTIIKVGQLGAALNATVTTANGIRAVAASIKSMHVMAALSAVRSKVAAIAQGLWNQQLYYGRTAMYAWTFGAKLATVQAIAMRAAILGLMAVTGAGIAIAAVAGIISMFASDVDDATESMKEANREAKNAEEEAGRLKELQDAETTAYTNAASALNIYQQKLKNLIGQKASGKDVSKEEKKIVGELNDAYGESMGYFDSMSKWYDALVANSETYCRQLVLEAKMRTLSARAAEEELEAETLQRKILSGTLSKEREKRTVGTQGGKTSFARNYNQFGIAAPTYQKVDVPGTSEEERTIRQLQQVQRQIRGTKAEMKSAAEEASQLVFRVKGSTTPPVVDDVKVSRPSGAAAEAVVMRPVDIGKDEVLADLAELETRVAGLEFEPVEVEVGVDGEKLEERFRGARESVIALGQSLSGLGDAVGVPALNVAGTVAQAVATLSLSYAEAMKGAGALGPWAWVAFAAAGLAQLTAVIGTVKQVTAFADGGVVSGPTLALVGEYSGARSNPEVIAPLDKLRSMILPAGDVGGRVVFEIDGRRLVGVLEKEHRYMSRR